ncbi:hypothetical protein MRY87_06735 [bacterium]|nr:hypothetical protein [bacterium]
MYRTVLGLKVLILTLFMSCIPLAFASAPFVTERPDRDLVADFEGVWKGRVESGVKIPGTCKNPEGKKWKMKVKMCIVTNSEDNIDDLNGTVKFLGKKKRPRLLQRSDGSSTAKFRRAKKKNKIRASFATSGSNNPGGEASDAAFIYFQQRLNNDNSRHGNLTVEIADEDASELDESGNPIYEAGDLVVSLGNCISGVLKKTVPGSTACN